MSAGMSVTSNMERGMLVVSAVLSPVTGLIATLSNTIFKILKVVSFKNFWETRGYYYEFDVRLADTGRDLYRIALCPILYIGWIFSSLQYVVDQHDGASTMNALMRFFSNERSGSVPSIIVSVITLPRTFALGLSELVRDNRIYRDDELP